MNNLSNLQLAKDFIELSILMSPNRLFIPSIYNSDNKHQMILHQAISELKRDGIINVSLSIKGEIVITLNKEPNTRANRME